MKILHVIPSVSPIDGGPSYALRRMSASLVKMGLEVDVATTNANGKDTLEVPLFKSRVEEGVRYFYFPRQFPKRWTFSPPLAHWLDEHARDYDLLHIHALFSYPTLPACHSARRAKVPYVLRPLGTLGAWSLTHKAWRKSLYYHFFERRNLLHASAIQATSLLEAQSLERLGFKACTFVIPLAVESIPSPSRSKPNSPARLLFLSRLHPTKALPVLFQSLALLRQQGICPTLTVVGNGEGSYQSVLQKYVKTLGLESQVEFTGFLEGEEKARAFASADIFVLPSYQESFGLAAAEAMAAGLPVVVSDQVGISPDILQYGAGLVVPCKADSLKEGLKKLIDAPGLRLEMGRQGQQLVRDRFHPEVVGAKLLSLYTKIIQREPLLENAG